MVTAVDVGGSDYVEVCREKGVPVPDVVFDQEWTYWGIIPEETEFVEDDRQAELFSWQPEDKSGICLALPRYYTDTGVLYSNPTGLICLGYESSRACFFDLEEDTVYKEGEGTEETHSISKFAGGTDLAGEPNDRCSECHAGRNPFVTYPSLDLNGQHNPFRDLAYDRRLTPDQWHEPLVPKPWPDNPGPIPKLPVVGNKKKKCSSCHSGTGAVGKPRTTGRFPRFWYQTSNGPKAMDDYCNYVLEPSLNGNDGTDPTMPLGALSQSHKYKPHAEWLTAKCGQTPGGGTTTTYEDPGPPEMLSPPIVASPIWECSEQAVVYGYPGADVTLTVYNNQGYIRDTYTKTVGPRGTVYFTVSPEFAENESVVAEQTYDNNVSGDSNPVTVDDYFAHTGRSKPPPPRIHEPVYECSRSYGVEAVNGAEVRLYRGASQADTLTGGPATLTWARISTKFNQGEALVAEQSLCGHPSDQGQPVEVKAAPGTLTKVRVEQKTVYEGQTAVDLDNITEGSAIDVGFANHTGSDTIESYPFRWYNGYPIGARIRTLQKGDVLTFDQTLCDSESHSEMDDPVVECTQLPPPKVERPVPGDDEVIVYDAAPGAKIRVFLEGVEIGHGPAPRILLSQTLDPGDIVKVIQQLEDCKSGEARLIEVQGDNTDG